MGDITLDGGVPRLPEPQPSVSPAPSLPPLPPWVDPSSPGSPVPSSATITTRPTFEYQPLVPLGPGQLPRGMREVSPWGRLAAYLLELVVIYATVLIAWIVVMMLDVDVVVELLIYVAFMAAWAIWALALGSGGQTPAKRMLGHTVIAADTHSPVGLARMIWVRGILAGFLAQIAVICTLGIVLFMPFWNKHNQNIWDRISNCYVVRRP